MGNDIIHKAEEYVRSFFASDFSGHDNDHTMRVYRTACRLAEEEGADMEITALAALLHDVDDRKISPETSESKLNAENFLKKNGVPSERCERILQAVKEVSFEGTDSVVPSTIEGKCVQDADRLDALGAVGIGRAFAYGGSHRRRMHDPDEAPVLNMNKEEYRSHVSTTVNHFYEKLFLLKDRMNTRSGRRTAEERDRFMHVFIERFLREWEGTDEEREDQ